MDKILQAFETDTFDEGVSGNIRWIYYPKYITNKPGKLGIANKHIFHSWEVSTALEIDTVKLGNIESVRSVLSMVLKTVGG